MAELKVGRDSINAGQSGHARATPRNWRTCSDLLQRPAPSSSTARSPLPEDEEADASSRVQEAPACASVTASADGSAVGEADLVDGAQLTLPAPPHPSGPGPAAARAQIRRRRAARARRGGAIRPRRHTSLTVPARRRRIARSCHVERVCRDDARLPRSPLAEPRFELVGFASAASSRWYWRRLRRVAVERDLSLAESTADRRGARRPARRATRRDRPAAVLELGDSESTCAELLPPTANTRPDSTSDECAAIEHA